MSSIFTTYLFLLPAAPHTGVYLAIFVLFRLISSPYSSCFKTRLYTILLAQYYGDWVGLSCSSVVIPPYWPNIPPQPWTNTPKFNSSAFNYNHLVFQSWHCLVRERILSPFHNYSEHHDIVGLQLWPATIGISFILIANATVGKPLAISTAGYIILTS